MRKEDIIMYKWEKVNLDIHKVLSQNNLIDGRDYSTFTRPDNHIIYECNRDSREAVIKALREAGYSVIENDEWCGGRRIGVVVHGFYTPVE